MVDGEMGSPDLYNFIEKEIEVKWENLQVNLSQTMAIRK